MSDEPVWALITGGGTAGHVTPAIAVGQALVARGHPPSSIRFVGSARGIEATMVPDAGFDVVLLPGRGIARRLSAENVGAAAGLIAAAAKAAVLLRKLRPKVVLSVGGYASFPCALAAIAGRVPVVVAEQNATPGLANRIAGRFAAASAVAFPGTPLPRPVVTGNPVRPEVAGLDRSPSGKAAARRALGLPIEGTVVAVAGGSLGARRINDAAVALAGLWNDRSGLAVRHVVGRRDMEEMSSLAPPSRCGGLVYQQVPFEDRMDLLLAAADVAVMRAGASTVAELAAAGLPSILVPLPGAPGDHQGRNARRFESAGAAIVVPDAELDGERLAFELERMIRDNGALTAMGDSARSLAHPDAAEAVAVLMEEHARH